MAQTVSQFSMKLEDGEKITKVMVNHGWIVDGIGFETIDRAGGGNKIKLFNGGPNGSGNYTEIPLADNEYITQLSGTYGKYSVDAQINISSLKIHTNLQVYGPYGIERQVSDVVPFTTPEIPAGSLTGVFGSYALYLASIGVTAQYGPYGRS